MDTIWGDTLMEDKEEVIEAAVEVARGCLLMGYSRLDNGDERFKLYGRVCSSDHRGPGVIFRRELDIQRMEVSLEGATDICFQRPEIEVTDLSVSNIEAFELSSELVVMVTHRTETNWVF